MFSNQIGASIFVARDIYGKVEQPCQKATA